MLVKHINITMDLRVIDLFEGELFSAQCFVPLLNDNGTTIRGSDAISIYLIEKYAKEDQLYPMNQEKLAVIHAQLQFLNLHIHSNFLRLFELVITKKNWASIEFIKANIYVCYEQLDHFLKSNNFVGGNVITIADFSCLPTILCLNYVCLIDKMYPNLKLWISQMENFIFFHEVNDCAEKLNLMFKESAQICVRA